MLIPLLISALATGCVTVKPPPACASVEQFRQCTACTVSGLMAMSSDGHGFIGKLVLDNGECLNVSLSQQRSRRLLGEPAQHMTVSGEVLPYPEVSGGLVLGYRVKDRPIGRGLCGDYFLFVR